MREWEHELNKYSEQLKPCPFCGDAVKIRTSNDYIPSYGVDHYCSQTDHSKILIQLRWLKTPDAVVEMWNSRA